ncbi:hypothetical protein, partial [Collinsella aerofaciens]
MDTKNLKPDVGGGYPWDTDSHPSGPANPSGMGTASDFANQAVTDAAMANSESRREVLRRASDESSRVAHMVQDMVSEKVAIIKPPWMLELGLPRL